MALQVSIQYHGQNVTYEVTTQEDHVYRLCRKTDQVTDSGEYIPDKVHIRRKGKIWVSDLEDSQELVSALIAQINQFIPTTTIQHE